MSQVENATDILHCDDQRLSQAVAYVLANPGKQLRSKLTHLSCALLCNEVTQAAIAVGTAIEWLHSYSLVHDDLPAMDNDDLRRGKPTVHKKFDEATAILVGDGLQAAAFELLAREDSLAPLQRLQVIEVVATAVGFGGMVGGQALDMAAERQNIDADQLKRVHLQKTGALIRAAVLGGAICGGADEVSYQRLGRFADYIGLAFQITDDVLDVTRSSDELGKTAGKDLTADKSTYVSCLGLEGARSEAKEQLRLALEELESFGPEADALRQVAAQMVERIA